jgi:Na+-driven multidrug efflux pump
MSTPREVLLPEEPPAELEPASGADDAEAALPYSLRNEVRFFFGQGVPLCLSALLEWGAPPLITMFFAGATPQSAHLQSALGYGRVFFNVSMLMVLLGMNSYIWNVLPGCIGAARKDRIPHYFRRAVVLSTLGSLPCFALQFASEPIMLAVGVEPSVAADVGAYTRLMAGGAWLLLLECHVEAVFITSGYARCASFNSLLTGLGVDVLCNYVFLYRWRWGVRGAALAWSAVRPSPLAPSP